MKRYQMTDAEYEADMAIAAATQRAVTKGKAEDAAKEKTKR